jgi:D-aminoacyl-tRNA deacylase
MRLVIQRVSNASVVVDDQQIASINAGLLILVGAMEGDTYHDVKMLSDKVAHLRIMADTAGKMNCSVLDVQGAILLVSQFTLAADCRKGRRPSFTTAANPKVAEELYHALADEFRTMGIPTETGQFAAHMHVTLTNNGPVTICLDSRQL